MTEPITLLIAQIRGEGAAYKYIANGVVTQVDASGREGMGTLKVNPHLLEDEQNAIAFEVAPPLGQTAIAPDAAFNLKLLEGLEGGTSDDATVLVEHTWTQKETPAVGELFTNVFSSDFSTSVTYGRWSWQDATPFSPSERGNIEALVSKIHHGFATSNYSALAALSRTRDEELARGLDIDYALLEQKSRQFSQEWFGADDFMMAPLDLSVMQLQPRAGGRLVEVTDAKGYPLLRGRVEGGEVRPEFMVSHLPDGWTIVR